MKALFFTLVLFFSAVEALGADVTWLASQASAGGNGCRLRPDSTSGANTFVIENGNDVSVLFTGLGINLPAGSGGGMRAQRTCVLNIPAQLAPMRYFADVTQVLSYGLTKSAAAQASFSLKGHFFNTPLAGIELFYASGSSVNEPLLVAQRRNSFPRSGHPLPRNLCNRSQPVVGNYHAQIRVDGQRASRDDDLILYGDALDIRFELDLNVSACQ